MSTEQYPGQSPQFTTHQRAVLGLWWTSFFATLALALFEVWIGAGIAAVMFVLASRADMRLHETPEARQRRRVLADATCD